MTPERRAEIEAMLDASRMGPDAPDIIRELLAEIDRQRAAVQVVFDAFMRDPQEPLTTLPYLFEVVLRGRV